MLYIVPAFLYCLIFTNLQPRLLMTIFQSNMDNDADFRSALCQFNLYHYGSLFALYPILLFTNFNWVLFISMSCIIFPQIYSNGFNNTRPDISSVYYTRYLFSRFIIIVTIYWCRFISNAILEIFFSSNQITFSDSFVSASFLSKYFIV